MSTGSVVFAAEDWASYTALGPVAEELEETNDVTFLLLDDFFARADHDQRDIDIDRERIEFPYVDSTDYIRTKYVHALPSSPPRAMLQRFVLDNLSHRIAFDVGQLFRDTTPDAFVSAVDSTPLIRHVIKECHDSGIFAATVQHGMYEYALNEEILDERTFFPDVKDPNPYVERIKRQFGFRYGITEYCHPYSDVVFTMGDFFTDVIRGLRSAFPAMGTTEITSSGTPEYASRVTDYSPDTDSLLFLSQPKYENGNWGKEQFDSFVEHLRGLNGSIPVTVRPHPKDPPNKIDRLAEDFRISEEDNLAVDVSEYDVITTVNSTAIFEGIVQGKVCGIQQLPWDNSSFPPLTHDHLLQFDQSDISIDAEAENQSTESQYGYLRNFCYMPSLNPESEFQTSAELIASSIIKGI